jgi:ATP-dependent Clp endopeptidase proteolytic subunit ClpP
MPEMTYRWRGHTPPTAGTRASVLNFVDPADEVVDGVATLRLYDPIDSWGGDWGVSAKEFAKALDALPDDTAEIRLHVNSPGGEVYEGIAIMNQLRAHKAQVTVVVDGLAASAASFIAASADKTIMGRNSQLMIHDAWGLAIGNAADMRDLADRLDKISDNIASVYADKTGGDVAQWRGAMLAETWYDADEAVTAGLADVALELKDEDKDAAAKAAIDLSVFQHAGREAAPAPVLPEAADEAPTAPPASAHERQNRHRRNALKTRA